MAVDQPNVIDIVAIRPGEPLTRLVIADHLDWTLEDEHLLALQAKLNAYLAFVESGQLSREYPGTGGNLVRIEVAFLHEPSQQAKENFLPKAAQIIEKAGLSFSWQVKAGAA
ncbi:DUF6572 domain-containing protein [Geothrix alkalitolerans]|uniref:DUF6572 domain-containing protein n=1 Tax=Geothrix alkalitolerans TaxID=2922724 RepID=UPI003B849FFF